MFCRVREKRLKSVFWFLPERLKSKYSDKSLFCLEERVCVYSICLCLSFFMHVRVCFFSLCLQLAIFVPMKWCLFERNQFGRCPQLPTRILQIFSHQTSSHPQSLPAMQPGRFFLPTESPSVISSPWLPLIEYLSTDRHTWMSMFATLAAFYYFK